MSVPAVPTEDEVHLSRRAVGRLVWTHVHRLNGEASLLMSNMMNHQLEHKRALVTGGSRGIGAAIVKRLAREGAHVALTYVSRPDQANETAKVARALGAQAIAIHADNADAQAVVAAVERTVRELGGLDIPVNNAGIAVMAPIDDYRLEEFDRMVAVNLHAVFVATQAAVKHMKAGGRIIMIGSCNAESMPFGGGGVYSMG